MAYTTINKSTDYFNTTLHTGNGSTQSITGVGFQPDLTWIKRRSADGWHFWTDAVRGATKTIFSNRSDAESTETGGLTAFGTDGFTVGSGPDVNGNGQTHVAWNWLANGSGSANYDGSITSTVSANTTAGFSIVKYVGTGSNATIGHGLGSVPKMIIVKRLSNAENWTVYHTSLGNTNYIDLDAINASTTFNMWQNTDPTSSVFSITTHNRLNANGDDYIAYCFAELSGYSKFGSYIGNGNADGTFVYTGFKPAMVILKNTSTTGNWQIMDNKRNTDNPVDTLLKPNDIIADQTPSDAKDFLSNGFKLRNSATEDNGSGNTFIYMAFGQSLVGSNNVPCTAR